MKLLLVARSVVVSANNTAKKREIFEGMAKSDNTERNSMVSSQRLASGSSEKSKIEDAVFEIKDILAR